MVSRGVPVLRHLTPEVAAGALVLALNMTLVPAVDGRMKDRFLYRGFAIVDRCDGVADDHPEQRCQPKGMAGMASANRTSWPQLTGGYECRSAGRSDLVLGGAMRVAAETLADPPL